MSICDQIVVMKQGVLQQTGKPQDIYDDPKNLFVAKFLGTPPINVFSGRVEDEKIYIGEEPVLTVGSVMDQEVTIGIRPEGFELDDNGSFTCNLRNVEVMGRDVSVVSSHPAAQASWIRSIIDADNQVDTSKQTVKFRIKPHKLYLFHKETEERIPFRVR